MFSNSSLHPIHIGLVAEEPVRMLGLVSIFDRVSPEDKLHLLPVAGRIDDVLAREGYDRSIALETSIGRTLALNGLAASDLDHVELYSCFPTIPKMARRVLDWPLVGERCTLVANADGATRAAQNKSTAVNREKRVAFASMFIDIFWTLRLSVAKVPQDGKEKTDQGIY